MNFILKLLGLGQWVGLIPVINSVLALKNDNSEANREAVVKAAGDFVQTAYPALSPEVIDIENLDLAIESYIADKSTANIENAAGMFAKLIKDVAAPQITDEHFIAVVTAIQNALADEGVK